MVLCVIALIVSDFLRMVHPVEFAVDILVHIEAQYPTVCKERVATPEHKASWDIYWIGVPTDHYMALTVGLLLQGNISMIGTLNETRALDCSNFPAHKHNIYIQRVFHSHTKAKTFIATHDLSYNDVILRDSINLLISHLRWDTFIILTDMESGVLSDSIQNGPYQMVFTVNHSPGDIASILSKMYKLLPEEDLNFIALCSTHCILECLHQANVLELDTYRSGWKTSRWIVSSTNGNIYDVINTNMSIKWLHVAALQPIQENFTAMVMVDSVNLQLTSFDRDSRFLPGTIYKGLSRRCPIKCAEIYELTKVHSRTEFRHKGHVTSNRKLSFEEDLFQNYGFNNRTFIVGVLEWYPFIIKKESNDTVTYEGISIDLLKQLSISLNFSYVFMEPADQEWGQVSNGKWTGIIGDLAYGRTDMTIAPVASSDTREEVMDFTVPYLYIHSGLILRAPGPDTSKLWTLVAPLRIEVIICIIISLVTCTLLLFVSEELTPVNSWTENRICERRSRYGNILMYQYGALMANGGAYKPDSNSGRTLLSCWWLFTVVVAAIYSGNLIAFLADTREKLPFTNIQEMAEQDTYQWGIVGGSIYVALFGNSSRPEFQKLWKGIVEVNRSNPDVVNLNPEVHYQKVLDGNYVFIGDESVAQVWKNTTCNVQMIDDNFFTLKYGVGLPNNSASTAIFSRQMMWIHESGLPRMWYNRWMPKIRCEGPSREAKRVDLLALQSAFYAAIAGVLIAVLVLISETVSCRRRHKLTISDPKTGDT